MLGNCADDENFATPLSPQNILQFWEFRNWKRLFFEYLFVELKIISLRKKRHQAIFCPIGSRWEECFLQVPNGIDTHLQPAVCHVRTSPVIQANWSLEDKQRSFTKKARRSKTLSQCKIYNKIFQNPVCILVYFFASVPSTIVPRINIKHWIMCSSLWLCAILTRYKPVCIA